MMQDLVIECGECKNSPEEYLCAICGRTGAEIAEARWLANLWAVIDPEKT